MAEQLALQQAPWYCRTVERDERAGAQPTGQMQSVRDDLFASPGLALDEHGGQAAREVRDELAHLPHAITFANQAGQSRFERVPGSFDDRGPRRSVPRGLAAQEADQRAEQSVHVQRLGEKVARPSAQCPRERGRVGMRGDQHDGQRWTYLRHLLAERDAVGPRHGDISEQQVVALAHYARERSTRGGGGRDPVALGFEQDPQRLASVRLVIHDQQARWSSSRRSE